MVDAGSAGSIGVCSSWRRAGSSAMAMPSSKVDCETGLTSARTWPWPRACAMAGPCVVSASTMTDVFSAMTSVASSNALPSVSVPSIRARRNGLPSARARVIFSSAAAAESQAVACIPQDCTYAQINSRQRRLSSTTRTGCCRKASAGEEAPPADSYGRAFCSPRLSENSNVLPTPGTLLTPIVPPMMPTRRRQIDRPRPVPPNCRVVEVSACSKASKIASRLFSGIPIPVSRTRKRSCTARSCTSSSRTWISTSPTVVNLMALPTRLRMIWRMRSGSPITWSGTAASTDHSSSRRFSCARTASTRMVCCRL